MGGQRSGCNVATNSFFMGKLSDDEIEAPTRTKSSEYTYVKDVKVNKLADKEFSYAQQGMKAEPHKINFNKSGFSTVSINNIDGKKIRLELTIKPLLKTDGSASSPLTYSDQYSKWTLAGSLKPAAWYDINMWYDQFQKFFAAEYALPVVFRDPHKEGTIYMNWPRTYIDGTSTSVHVPVQVNRRAARMQGGQPIYDVYEGKAVPMMPDALLAMQEFRDIITNGAELNVDVEPSVWVRTEAGSHSAGVSWNISQINLNVGV